MTIEHSYPAPANGISSGELSPFQAALIATVLVYGAVFAQALLGGAANLISTDYDSQMRLVQVRDFMAGQNWFDLTQYRMGPDGGFVMHWSRFIDLPIAALMAGSGAILGPSAGEYVGLTVWPALMFLASVYLIVRASVQYAGKDAAFPATVIAALSLYMIGEFNPGVIDHHNVQIACTLGMIAFLLEAAERPKLAYLAGACAGMMLAIGMETIFYVGCGGLAAAVWFLVSGEEARLPARNFGLGLAATGLFALVATKSPAQWFAVECDAFSAAQFVAGAIAGLGLALAASLPLAADKFSTRLAALAVIGLTLAGVALVWFPQCLDKPYMNMTPLTRAYLLTAVDETKPVTFLLQRTPELALLYYGATVTGLIWLAARIVRNGFRRDDMILLAILLPAVLVSFYQVRGMKFSTPVAAIPLAAMVAAARRRSASQKSLAAGLGMAGAWLASVNVFWFGLGAALAPAKAAMPASSTQSVQANQPAQTVVRGNGCSTADDFAKLNALPHGKVVSILQMGSPILRLTGQHPVGGWYHRNVAGSETALSILMAAPDEAGKIALSQNIAYVAVCASEPESNTLRAYAPDGLYARLLDGAVPEWLTLAPETAGEALQVYRVRGAAKPAA